MPYIYSEMQNKLSKTRESPLESMGQIISSRCPAGISLIARNWLSLDPSLWAGTMIFFQLYQNFLCKTYLFIEQLNSLLGLI